MFFIASEIKLYSNFNRNIHSHENILIFVSESYNTETKYTTGIGKPIIERSYWSTTVNIH